MDYTPTDCKSMTEQYRIDGGGICGQSCLAVIERTTIKNILNNWKKMGIEFKGWSGWNQLRKYLEKRGFIVRQLRKDNLNILNPNYFYIGRVQWIGNRENKEKPFYGWDHWSKASANTHFIVFHKGKFFCNEENKWINNYNIENYLNKEGIVTSLLELKRMEEK